MSIIIASQPAHLEPWPSWSWDPLPTDLKGSLLQLLGSPWAPQKLHTDGPALHQEYIMTEFTLYDETNASEASKPLLVKSKASLWARSWVFTRMMAFIGVCWALSIVSGLPSLEALLERAALSQRCYLSGSSAA